MEAGQVIAAPLGTAEAHSLPDVSRRNSASSTAPSTNHRSPEVGLIARPKSFFAPVAYSPSFSPVVRCNAMILPVPCSPTYNTLPLSTRPEGLSIPVANVLYEAHPKRVYSNEGSGEDQSVKLPPRSFLASAAYFPLSAFTARILPAPVSAMNSARVSGSTTM